MTDIVERLRDYEAHWPMASALLNEAADEIERMRSAAEVWVGARRFDKAAARAIETATIERCAQVADRFFNEPGADVYRKIAATIRTLRDNA